MYCKSTIYSSALWSHKTAHLEAACTKPRETSWIGASALVSQGDPHFSWKHRKADACGTFLSQGVQQTNRGTAHHAYPWQGHFNTADACTQRHAFPSEQKAWEHSPCRLGRSLSEPPPHAGTRQRHLRDLDEEPRSQLAGWKRRSLLHLRVGCCRLHAWEMPLLPAPSSSRSRLPAARTGITRRKPQAAPLQLSWGECPS